MNKVLKILPFFIFLFLIIGSSQAEIMLDGDSTDWQMEPLLISWVNNAPGWYPDEVGAAITDVVNVRHVKAKFVGNAFYVFMRFWGTPAWPSNNDEKSQGDSTYYRSRGYYHLLMDLDNNPATGWNTDWYETHYTPVGYLRSQGQEYDVIGSEGYVYIGLETRTAYDGGGVGGIGYGMEDHSGKNYQDNTGVKVTIYDQEINDPDSAKAMAWQGTIRYTDGPENLPVGAGLRSFWAGHAWGQVGDGAAAADVDFLEMGYEMTPHTEYWANKGLNYFNAGDVIGVSAFIETPSDDWGVDLTSRGQVTIPEALPERPQAFTFDGDSADWAGVPMGCRWVNNAPGWYPDEVGAAITDVINVRNVKAVAHENAMYFFMRFWGAPAWPNNVDEKSQGDSTYFRSRGYYHLLLDVDNNPATGWNTDWYETHYTPVGYLRSQGQEYDVIGSETYVYLGEEYRTAYDGGGVGGIGYGAEDHSGKNYQDNTGVKVPIYDISITDPDSSLGMQHDGMLVGEPNVEIVGGLLDGDPLFFAHAWGIDFLESGYDIRPHKAYWLAKDGSEIFKPGDVIGFAAFIETPADDWGVDLTSRGETSVVSGIWGEKQAIVADKYVLENNYPNPFNPTTTINFQTPKASDVTMLIYNTLGQKVKTLVNENMPIGKHTVVWDGRNDAGQMLPTGMYFYTLKAGSTSLTKKMLLVK